MMQENQHVLEITEQPKKIFHNQQFGKRHGFWISVRTNFSSESLKLQAELLYADNFERPKAMKIARKKTCKPLLEILDKQDFEAGHAKIYCRINDVSRNHGGKHFSILLKCVDGKKCIAETYTQAIKVISKAPKASQVIKVSKKKRKRSSPPLTTASSSCATAPKKTRIVESLFRRGFQLLQNITHNNRVGYFDEECTQPIRQCPMCLGRNSPTVANPKHTSSCPVVALLEEYETTINSPEDGVHELHAKNSSDAVCSTDSISSTDGAESTKGANPSDRISSTNEAANNPSNSINSPDSIMADMSAIEERDSKLLLDVFGDEDFDMCGSNFSLDFLSEDELDDTCETDFESWQHLLS